MTTMARHSSARSRPGAPVVRPGPGGASYTDGASPFGVGGVADPADAPSGAPDREGSAQHPGPGQSTRAGRTSGGGTAGGIAILAFALAALGTPPLRGGPPAGEGVDLAARPGAPSDSARTDAPLPGETVVMLHGVGLGSWAMTRLAAHLRAEGYRVVNRSYPSRTLPLERLAHAWLPKLLEETGSAAAPRLHFVTHSMGGIVVRAHLARSRPPNLGRIVMLAPPHHGSEVVDHLGGWWAFRLFTGINGPRLGTDPASFPLGLPPWDPAVELGVIAGSRSLNPVFSAWIGAESDGKVSIASSRLPGMRDHLVLPHSHTWLQYRRDTCEAVARFLRTGRFR